jgi:hypothetical protein
VPVAAKAWVAPFGTVALGGVRARLFSVAVVTFSVAVALSPVAASVAVTVAVPAAAAVATPSLPAAFDTEATEGDDEVHVTEAVSVRVVPSL